MDKSFQKTISLLGSGWLGGPLAKLLINEGYIVKASTTTPLKTEGLKNDGVQPYLLNLNPEEDPDKLLDFLNSEILLINIPPGTRKKPGSDFHLKQMSFLLNQIKKSPVKKILYVSSTSVYPDLNREVKESDVFKPEAAGNSILALAEEMVKDSGCSYCILRMGGLTGYDRLLIKYFVGKKDLKGGNAPVNMIHRDDCLSIIETFLKKGKWNNVYNCCSPLHPSKKDFYTFLAEKFKQPYPHFSEDDKSSWKQVSPQKLIEELEYKFIFPDPFEYTY